MKITLKELKEIFGDAVPNDPADQKLFLELNEGVIPTQGLKYLQRNKERLLAEWDHIVNDLL